jgi:hypothetical protein
MREFASLVQGPSPAVLTTYRKDATAAASPGLVPIPRPHLRGRDRRKRREARPPSRPPECELLVFEAVPPFRGIHVRSDQPVLTRDVAQQARQDIAARYLGEERRKRFAAERTSTGVLLRLPADHATG